MHKWIWFAVFFGCVSFSLAKPMPPFPMQHIQSNGDTLTFYQRGDEFEHYKETLDGYILVFCDKDLCFAICLQKSRSRICSASLKPSFA